MSQIEIQSLETRTRVQPVGREPAVVEAGKALVFDANAPVPPIIVQPDDPGGGGVILVKPTDFGTLPLEELADRTARLEGRMVLGIRDADAIQLTDLQPLAELAARERRRLVVRIGDG